MPTRNTLWMAAGSAPRRSTPSRAWPALASLSAQKGQETSVVLRIDKSNSVQDLVGVADVIAKLNLRMVLATDKKR